MTMFSRAPGLLPTTPDEEAACARASPSNTCCRSPGIGAQVVAVCTASDSHRPAQMSPTLAPINAACQHQFDIPASGKAPFGNKRPQAAGGRHAALTHVADADDCRFVSAQPWWLAPIPLSC